MEAGKTQFLTDEVMEAINKHRKNRKESYDSILRKILGLKEKK